MYVDLGPYVNPSYYVVQVRGSFLVKVPPAMRPPPPPAPSPAHRRLIDRAAASLPPSLWPCTHARLSPPAAGEAPLPHPRPLPRPPLSPSPLSSPAASSHLPILLLHVPHRHAGPHAIPSFSIPLLPSLPSPHLAGLHLCGLTSTSVSRLLSPWHHVCCRRMRRSRLFVTHASLASLPWPHHPNPYSLYPTTLNLPPSLFHPLHTSSLCPLVTPHHTTPPHPHPTFPLLAHHAALQEDASLAKVYTLFRTLGLRHLVVIPRATDVVRARFRVQDQGLEPRTLTP